ncbi:MAG: hypothetical protein OCD02_07965 [Spirochaetaceae bacterium]
MKKFNLFVTLSGLFSVFMIFSLRLVWVLINKFVKGAIPLGDNSFLAAYIFVLFLLITSIISLIRIHKGKKYNRVLTTIYLSFQLAVYWGLVAIIYPEVQSLYLQLLPIKLLQNGVLIVSIFISGAILFFTLKKDKNNLNPGKIIIYSCNSLLFVAVLCMAYMAFTVRSPKYYANKIKKDIPVYDHSANPKFPVTGPKTIKPDLSIKLDTEDGGIYWIAGDLTGDGVVEIITMRYYVEMPDINRVATFAVQDLEGNVLWSWRNERDWPSKIGMGRGSSAAFVVFNQKLYMATDGFLRQFNGLTGEIEKKIAVGAVDSSDCLILADLDGNGKKDFLLKDAYHTIWAFDKDLNLLWKERDPGGFMLAHRIAAYDLDSDGIDEIITGAAILNADGTVRTTLKSNSVKLWYGGHIDGIVPIKQNGEWNIGVTYCDASGVALYDVNGNNIWEVTGEHFEYLIGGYFFPNDKDLKDQFQLMTKVHYQDGNPQALINQDGEVLKLFSPGNTAFSVDWTGDGYHEFIFANPSSIYSGEEKLFDLQIPGIPTGNPISMRVADFIGRNSNKPDGIPDIGLRVEVDGEHYLHIYKNENGKKPKNYVYPGIGWEEAANYFTKYYEYDR